MPHVRFQVPFLGPESQLKSGFACAGLLCSHACEASKRWIPSIARFTLLRWAVNEDDDEWLARRGQSRQKKCALCANTGRAWRLSNRNLWGRGMGSPIPSAQEGAWTARVPRLLSEGVVASPVDLFDLEP